MRLTAFALLLCAGAARAAEPMPAAPLVGFDKMALALIVVVAAIGGLALLLRRVNGAGQRSSGVMKTLASVPLGPRERVVLMEFGETWLVLGVTSQSVTCLHSLPKGELPAAGINGGIDFATMLARTLRNRAS